MSVCPVDLNPSSKAIINTLRAMALGVSVLLIGIPTTVSAYEQVGNACWYGPRLHGRITANGERFNQNKLTAAHQSLPFGTKARVTNLDNKKSVRVTINDRGPHVGNCAIDVSRAAARRLGMTESGIVRVKIEAATK
ncbi:exported hypothetical protein [Candidatus Competibacter denitrificans Run_A_D11]|uniref:Endolytic peptidoglycan transglycosylase RlpA n=2 Tax=Candidatus Competibacter TaxID=221279 RepID=W6M4I6_9GAMM|nr:exported hypothetical protein [Candidatus Competibacter denitrificans Run_A_D11]HAS87021.1 septal ring lytic transglycosylase RlpA family protein [Candidatus Competibacteraceae bacterium]